MKEFAVIGIDGAGKSSVVSNLFDYFSCHSAIVCKKRTKSYNDKLLAEMIKRGQYMSDTARLYAAYFDFLHEKAMRNDAADIILWDRYYLCLLAYYSALGENVSEMQKVFAGLESIDKIIYLSVPPDLAVSRIMRRGTTVKPLENVAYLSSVQRKYEEFIAQEKKEKIVVVDGTMSENAVWKTVLDIIM